MTSNVTPSAQQEYDQLFADKSKSSKHPEDLNNLSDDEHHPSDDEDPEHFFEKDEDLDDLDQTELRMRSRYFLPRMRQEANTGPKGVIADAQSFEQAKKSQRFSFFRSNKDLPQVEDLSVNGNNDEEGFMERWRRNRLAELQEPNSRQRSSSRGTSPGKRVFGNLLTVDAEGYLDAVDYTGDNVNVIVLIYDDNSQISEMVEDCVRDLARQHKNTRFVRLHYEEAEFQAAGVPAILAYRGGDKIADMVPVMEEMPDDADLSPAALESVMMKKQMLY